MIDDKAERKKYKTLPESYSNVKPAYIAAKDPKAPELSIPHDKLQPNITTTLSDAKEKEKVWLHGCETISKDEDNEGISQACAPFHAQSITKTTTPVESSMRPLFHEKADTPAMIKHTMELAITITEKLSPGQTPVLYLDEPLYAQAKKLQWQHAHIAEDKIVIMLGGLHIEMAILSLIGTLLKESGWSEILADAGVTTPGRAEAMTGASDVKAARYAHQVTCAALHRLMKNSYEKDRDAKELKTKENGESETFEEWKERRRNDNPLFFYWALILDLEILLNIYIRSLREGNFQLHLEVLTAFVPWFMALDRINYRRWLPFYLKDMANLKEKHPLLHQKFSEGHFVASRSEARFSAIAGDQVIV